MTRDTSATEGLIAALRRMQDRGCEIRLLQIGACDGTNFDPVHRSLNQAANVSGTFVEPVAEYLLSLVQAKQSLTAISILNVAVSNYDGMVDIRYVDPEAIRTGIVPKWAMGISTIEKGRNAVDGMKIGDDVFQALKRHIKTRTVPVLSTRTLMSMAPCRNSNVYLSDCEGHDATIFMDLDLSAYRPAVLFMEGMLMTRAEKASVLFKLSGFGYSVIDDGTDILASKHPFGAITCQPNSCGESA